MKKHRFIFLIIFLLPFFTIRSQVAINTNGNPPDNSAMLDIKSSDKGILIPRLTTIQRNNIDNPATGLMVFDTDENSFYYYSGDAWGKIADISSFCWESSGNNITNTNSGNVGIGTTTPEELLDITDEASSSPGIILQRGTNSDTYSDWKVENLAGKLGFFERGFDGIWDSLLTFSYSGDVGIGTNNPLASLHSSASGNNKLIIESTDDNEAQLELKSSDSKALMFYRNHDNDFGIYFDGRPDYNGTVFRLDGNGDILLNGRNVGIGTTTPSEKLQVAGNLYLKGESTWSSGEKITIGSSEPLIEICRLGNTRRMVFNSGINQSTNGGFEFRVDDISKMYLNPTGNLGIGTLSPSEALHVVGNIVLDDGNQSDGRVLVSDNNGKAQWQNLSAGTFFGSNFSPDYSCLSEIGSLAIGGEPSKVQVSGNYAYVVDKSSDDLKIIDISDPSTPTLTSSLALGGPLADMVVSNNYAYIINNLNHKLKIVNISNASSPTLTSTMDIDNLSSSIEISGNYVYISHGYGGTKVINVSNPANPVLTNTIPTGQADDISINGNYLYTINSFLSRVDSWNISNPSSITHSDYLTLANTPSRVCADGTNAYILSKVGGNMKVIDISNPSTLSVTGTFSTGSSPEDLIPSDDHVYIIDASDDDLRIVDISTPSNPTLTASLTVNGGPSSIGKSENNLFICHIEDNSLNSYQVICLENLVIAPDGSITTNTPIWTGNSTKINYSGNVGIGETSPSELLHLTDVSSSTPGMILQRGSSNDSYSDWKIESNSGDLNFLERGGDGTWDNLATIDYEGNLGIGTTEPACMLSVIGGKPNGHIAMFENNDFSDNSNNDGILVKLAMGTGWGESNNFMTFKSTNWEDGDHISGEIEMWNYLENMWPSGTWEEVICDLMSMGVTLGNPIDMIVYAANWPTMNMCNEAGVSFTSNGADYAEYIEKADPNEVLLGAQVVGVKDGEISKVTVGADKVFAISTRPIIVGNSVPDSLKDNYGLAAFLGQVHVYVTGKVNAGDFIVANGKNNGAAIAIAPKELIPEQLNQVVGQAWESSDIEELKLINTAVGLNSNEVTNIFKKQQSKIDELETRIEDLTDTEKKIVSLENRIKELSEVEERLNRIERMMNLNQGTEQYTSK